MTGGMGYRRAASQRTHRAPPPASARTQWVKATGAARDIARKVRGTTFNDVCSARDAIADLVTLTRGLVGLNFPVEREVSGMRMAEAFLKVCEAFATATPEHREMFAPALDAAAQALIDLLDELRTAEANSTWKRRLGERDD